MSSPPETLVTDADPAADDALQCPLCDYDLRGLLDPRCPECGYAFDWADLRDPARRKHKYLFEHHPERNVWSFVRTLLGGLRPRKFWGGLLPSQASSPRRLLIYALPIAVSTTLPVAALAVHLVVQPWGILTLQGPAFFWRTSILHAGVLFWPALSLAALMIFQWSMRRARIRPSHFARCVVYSADVILWVNLFLATVVMGVTLRQVLFGARLSRIDLETYGVAASCAFAAALLVFIYRLIVALKKYVRFDHPAATILVSQFIVLLVVLILVTWQLTF